nr:hypothetical protein [Klebsiella pneumoniae]
SLDANYFRRTRSAFFFNEPPTPGLYTRPYPFSLHDLALAMHQAGKPLGFMCIAPAMLPKIFAFPLRMTIGTDLDTADVVEEMGAEHVPCPVDDIVVDEDNKVVTTPAYMLAEDIAQAATGIEKLVARVLALSA